MKRNKFVWIGLLALLLIGGAVFAQEGDDVTEESPYVGDPRLPIPEFPEDIDWINIDGSLTVDDLRGKIVIMDFWTYGCINCIHMIPILERLEEEFPEELVVIGVHSAKFQNEGETENIEQIVQRYGVHHPVINDSEFTVWQTFGIRAWPTLLIADPRGNVLAAQSGEIPYEAFKPLIDGMIEYFDETGELNREPLEISPEGEGRPNALLHFPGKVLVDTAGERLFIADSSNHRYIITDLNTYEVLDVIGTGQRGFDDGGFDEATFNTPQGMALRDNKLYIADTYNHALRVIDLEERTVSTFAGTGEMGRGIQTFNTLIREPLGFALRSPWDVEFAGDTLYIAMAGTHQIWEADIVTGQMRPSVGNGREAALNATLDTSELAQPSGLYFSEGLLYFADSESSTIRVADYNNNTVMTASGTLENNLFDFGDEDGPVGESRLQHALGVDGDGDGLVYVADTYNSKIKVIDSAMNTTTLFGQDGNGGFVDGGPDVAAFDEPGGLDYVELADGSKRLYVADTNNHAIRVIDLDENVVTTIQFPNPEALQIQDRVTVIGGGAGETTVRVAEQAVSVGAGNIVIRLQMPEGYKLNDLATSLASWSTEDDAIGLMTAETVIDNLEMRIPVNLSEGEGTLNGDLTIYFCEAINESLCFIDQFTVEVPVSVSGEGDTEPEILIERELIPPQLEGVGGIS